MRKIFAILLLCFGLMANAKGTCDVVGTTYTVDTLFHAQVGPGTTQTSLLLQCGTKHLRVFYAKIDLTNPYVKIRSVSGTDMMAGGETVSSMSKRKSEPGQRYYIGVNGDFWFTSGTTSRGQSMVGTPLSTAMAKGVVYRAISNGEYQYTLDENMVPYLGTVNFGGTITKGSSSVNIGGVNADAANNVVTLYNPKYYKGTNQTGVTEVQVKFVGGDDVFGVGKTCQVVVANTPSDAGDMDVASDGLTLTGKGTAATFIAGLSVGDTLSLNLTASLNGQNIVPSEIVSGQPWVLNKGVVQNNGDTSVHPRTVLGYSEDGKTVIFLVVDGRSPLSDGATTAALGSLMKYAGAYMALNVDGGGSTCLYSNILGVRNKPSDGAERSDSNGIFAVCEAPDDDDVAEIQFQDFNLVTPKFGVYTPKFFGYNKYGTLVDLDVQGVKLTCDDGLGHVTGDSTFYADGNLPNGYLTGTYNGLTVKKLITIQNTVDSIKITNDSIITDTYKDYAVAVQTMVGETTMSINPAALTWKSTDESVVTIGENTGVLKGVQDGEAYVIGTLGNVCDTMKVIVEKPTAHVMPMDPNLDVTTWKISQTGGKNAVATANGNGIDYTYTGASGRAPKIVLTKTLRLWSLPDTVRLRINPGEAPVKNVLLGIRANGESVTYQTFEIDTLIANKELTFDLPTNSWIDATDMGKYPLVISSIQLNMNTSTTGTVYNMHFNGFETVYNAVAPEPAVKGDVNGDGKVDTSDLSALMIVILNNGTAAENPKADVNGDGKVDTTDISTLMTIILAA